MQMPKGYAEAQAGGDFVKVNLGGHKMVIKQVQETKSKTGADMIVVYFDFDLSDEQRGYFADLYKKDTRADKKWPNNGTKYIMVNDSEGNTNRDFKGFCTSVEDSNTGFKTQFGIADWGAQFKGKKIGGVFGEELGWYNGKETHKRILRWFCGYDKAADADIPNVKETKEYKAAVSGAYFDGVPATSSTDSDGFMQIPDGIDEELPFN